MFQRRITVDEVRAVLEQGEIIDENPDALPYPSRLMLGRVGGRSLHVVLAENRADDETVVVTVHEPDPALWQPGSRRRRSP
jgi:hypothetical protein